MGEYAPDDSRDVTLNPGKSPIEPERTGPREELARQKAAGEETVGAKTGDRFSAEAQAGADGQDSDPVQGEAVHGRPRA